MDLELVTKGKQLSENDQAILTYLATHINELEGVSLRKIATTLYTSPATIMTLHGLKNVSPMHRINGICVCTLSRVKPLP